MSAPTVYLAGPILNQTEADANDWRRMASSRLEKTGIRAVSPLRCEPPGVDGIYSVGYPDPKFGTALAIGSKNLFDVRNCMMVLAYFPVQMEEQAAGFDNDGCPVDAELVKRPFSLGTVLEVGWAFALGKPAVIASTDARLIEHPVFKACAGWIVPELDDGLEVVEGILGGYSAEGRNV